MDCGSRLLSRSDHFPAGIDGYSRDPSLRLKNVYAQDDSGFC